VRPTTVNEKAPTEVEALGFAESGLN